ncbi:Uncharacterized oxidoreductase YkpB [Seminavis robusta]|uniref:Uncharacterized oxidoreductase YkpB n=1 Tax=Seminavis robusta TaxID=568900 RepID=A0A9N8HSV9_9STRA|nr:Uncharacterized oxidoreductase YkpB [Seminavis robusta]|eukprot:Sro1497_g277610.1 Uncharacterized oxidoreductase YkpB (337) ;mRNA; r:15071-16081
MKILILGCGAVGGYFGGKLVQQGANVTFLVRPGRGEQLTRDGLRIENNNGQINTISNVQWITSDDDGESTESFDVIILTCKSYGLAGALQAVAPFCSPQVAILPLLNGMAHLDDIQQSFPDAIVWGGTCGIVATLTPDGTIKKMTESQFIVAGILLPPPDANKDSHDSALTPQTSGKEGVLQALIQLMKDAGIDANVSPDIYAKMWEKWTFLATLGAATCLLDATIGEIHSVTGGASYIQGVYRECNQVATSWMGKEPDAEQQEKIFQRVLGDTKSIVRASMARDMQNGNPTEADHILGDLIRRAAQRDIATPFLSTAYARLQIYEQQRRQRQEKA